MQPWATPRMVLFQRRCRWAWQNCAQGCHLDPWLRWVEPRGLCHERLPSALLVQSRITSAHACELDLPPGEDLGPCCLGGSTGLGEMWDVKRYEYGSDQSAVMQHDGRPAGCCADDLTCHDAS